MRSISALSPCRCVPTGSVQAAPSDNRPRHGRCEDVCLLGISNRASRQPACRWRRDFECTRSPALAAALPPALLTPRHHPAPGRNRPPLQLVQWSCGGLPDRHPGWRQGKAERSDRACPILRTGTAPRYRDPSAASILSRSCCQSISRDGPRAGSQDDPEAQ